MIPLRCAFQKKLWKATNDYCYSLTSSNVCTVKKICSRWYRSQFNKIEKAWVRVEILCLDFPKIRSNQYTKSRKVTTFEICEFYLFISHTYGAIKPPCWAAITREMFFFKNHAENEAGRLYPDFFLFLKKAIMWGKSKWSAA